MLQGDDGGGESAGRGRRTRVSASRPPTEETRATTGNHGRPTPGFGDTIDFEQIKRHYYVVHEKINPTQIVPLGPDPSGWVTAHGREALGGRPFGDGSPPGPPPPDEVVPSGHTPLAD